MSQQDQKQPIKILHTIEEAKSWRSLLDPRQKTVGFVPTMGALHQGHAELLRRVRPRCDLSVLSIFINPTQFGPNEDLSKYPRTLDHDLELARTCGVDAVFLPTSSEMYPNGYSTSVEETVASRPLCGKFRPGHFRGVTTVVLKLFNTIRPHLSLFGLKDAQQFFVLSRMARDLNLDVAVEGVATVRENDGLAMSSRNAYLSPSERQTAPALYQALRDAATEIDQGRSTVKETLAGAVEILKTAGFTIQYLELLELPDLLPATETHPERPYLLAAAVFLGNTRLIDNIILRADRLRGFRISI